MISLFWTHPDHAKIMSSAGCKNLAASRPWVESWEGPLNYFVPAGINQISRATCLMSCYGCMVEVANHCIFATMKDMKVCHCWSKLSQQAVQPDFWPHCSNVPCQKALCSFSYQFCELFEPVFLENIWQFHSHSIPVPFQSCSCPVLVPLRAWSHFGDFR